MWLSINVCILTVALTIKTTTWRNPLFSPNFWPYWVIKVIVRTAWAETGSKAQIGSNKKTQQTSWKFHLILPLLGSLNLSVSNAYGLTVSLYWITIVTSLASIVKMWYYARWIFRPMEQEMDFVTRLVAFIMLFTYRMLSWLVIITMLHWFSTFAMALLFGLNWFFLAHTKQDFLQISLVSLVLPAYQLPSKVEEVFKDTGVKTIVWLGIGGNIFLFLVLVIIGTLYSLDISNPWCSDVELRIPESHVILIVVTISVLFILATSPLLICMFDYLRYIIKFFL